MPYGPASRERYPGHEIVGMYSPPFRELTDEEARCRHRPDQRSQARVAVGGVGLAQAGALDPRAQGPVGTSLWQSAWERASDSSAAA